MVIRKKIKLCFFFLLLAVLVGSLSSCKSDSKKTIEVLEISSSFNYETNS